MSWENEDVETYFQLSLFIVLLQLYSLKIYDVLTQAKKETQTIHYAKDLSSSTPHNFLLNLHLVWLMLWENDPIPIISTLRSRAVSFKRNDSPMRGSQSHVYNLHRCGISRV